MNEDTRRFLIELDRDFYQRSYHSFSQTRQTPWPGWNRCLDFLGITDHAPYELLDLGCGNLRFEAFLEASYPKTPLICHAVDNCDPLVKAGLSQISAVNVLYHHCDLLPYDNHIKLENVPPCDGAVIFGLMHHVPGFEGRLRLLRLALTLLKPGGILAASFWHFTEDATLAAKARTTTARVLSRMSQRAVTDQTALGRAIPDRAVSGVDSLHETQRIGPLQLDGGDYILGWSKNHNVYRYAHDFSDADIEELVQAVCDRTSVADAFSADGRNGKLNSYRILRKHA